MRKTFVSASIHPGTFDAKQLHWPTGQGYSVQIELACTEERTDGSRLFINEDRSFQHWEFSKCWEWVAQVKLECDESK